MTECKRTQPLHAKSCKYIEWAENQGTLPSCTLHISNRQNHPSVSCTVTYQIGVIKTSATLWIFLHNTVATHKQGGVTDK